MKKFLPLVLVLLVATMAFAQQNRSRIVGTLTTADGAVIVGATVTIASDALIAREMTVATNERGMYRFVLLPIGTYNIRFEMEGYNTIEQTGITLGFESTVTLDKVMTPSEFERVVTITGEAPLIDKTDSSIGYQINLDYLQQAPNTRNVWNMPNIVAGFNDNSALGAVEQASQTYSTDGINVSDPSTKTIFSSINMEAVEQMDVAMFGAPAEYGSFTGAALNVVTKSGGNEFHGEVNYFMQSVDWVSDNTADYEQYGISAPTASKLTDPNFAVGGPVLQDRIWFFFNFNYQKWETERELIDDVVTQVENPKRSFLKFSARWDDRNITYFSWIYYKRDRSHRVAYGSWRTNNEDSLWQQVSQSDTFLIQHSYVITENLILEGRWGGFRGGFDLWPRVEGPMIRDYDTGNHLARSLSRSDLYNRPRDEYLVTLAYFNDDLHGTHSFKFGVNYERHMGNRFYTHTENIYYRNGQPYRWYDYGEYEGGRVRKRIAGFVQDSWSLSSRLTLNLGFRIDRWWAEADDPTLGGLAGSDTFMHMTDPAYRLGFAYDLFGDGSTVLRGFFGRYYEGVVSGNIEPMVTSVPPSRQYRWDGSAWYLYSQYGGSQPGEYEIDPNVSNQYTEGIMLGLERELMPNLAGALTFIYKWDNNQLGVIFPNATWNQYQANFSNANGSYNGIYYDDIQFGIPEYYTNPKKGDHGITEDLFRHYWALAFELTKRMSDNWSMYANYTFSRNNGTVYNTSYGVIQGFDTWNNPNDWINAVGRLGMERPHVFKFSGTYIAPFEIYISPIITYMSGRCYGLYYRPGGSDTDLLIKPVDGTDRYDYQLDVDLRLEKSFSFMDRFRVGVIFDVFNLFNDDAVTGHSNHRINSSTFERPTSIVRSRYYQLGFRFLF